MGKTTGYVLLLATAALVSCKNNQSGNGSSSKSSHTGDILVVNMDTTVSPAQDFFQAAVGGWLKRNPIPGDETSWGIGQLVNEELYTRKRNINESAAGKGTRTGIEQQVADFWTT